MAILRPTPTQVNAEGLIREVHAVGEGLEAEVVCRGNNCRTERPVSTGAVELGGGGESIPSLSV